MICGLVRMILRTGTYIIIAQAEGSSNYEVLSMKQQQMIGRKRLQAGISLPGGRRTMKIIWNREKLKNGILIAVCIVLAGAVFFYNILGGAGKKNNDGEEPAELITPEPELLLHNEKDGITQAEACRLLACLHYEKAQQSALDIPQELQAALQGKWYSGCVNAAVSAGYLSAEKVSPEEELTCGDFRDFLVAVCRTEELDYQAVVALLPERLSTVKEEDRLFLGEFLSVFEVLDGLMQEKGNGMLDVRQIYVFALEENAVLYDQNGNTYYYGTCQDYSSILGENTSGLPKEDDIGKKAAGRTEKKEMADYSDTALEILCSGNEILYIRGQLWQQAVIPNAWVLEASGNTVKAYINGYYKEYPTVLPMQGGVEEKVCDIGIRDGKVQELTIKSDVIQGKVLLTSSDMIEIEGYGRLEFAENYRIYKIYGDLAMEKTSRILVGYSITDFVVADGKICAALIKEKLKADTIRVLINTSGYKSCYHSAVELTADREFTVTRGDQVKSYAAGEVVRFSAKEEYEKNERVLINTVGGEGKITLLSVDRTCGHPAYRGSMEVSAAADGLLVVNELSLEEYLYAVIPSEMPTSYGSEALKVQAVCARSYAYNQLVASRFRAYGAHVDDSVSCQVYNNIAENDASILAVKETYGLVAAYAGSVITAYYFSTSCGHTADYKDVWEGAVPVSYLTGYLQNEEKESVDFSEEEKFREFITSNDIKTFERDNAWYRWQIVIPQEQLKEQAGGFDTVTGVEVTKRGTSGIILELKITGTKSENGKQVETEKLLVYQTAVRTVLAPKKTPVIRMDGSSIENMSLLPSAFFVVDEIWENGSLTAVLLQGGGYGHGTGMSQNGVKGLVDAGKSFEEIVEYYYTGTDLIFLY